MENTCAKHHCPLQSRHLTKNLSYRTRTKADPDGDRPDSAGRVVVLSYRFWSTRLQFGLVPAIRTTRLDLHTETRRKGTANLPVAMARTLLAAQAALSIVLSVGARLFARTLRNLG